MIKKPFTALKRAGYEVIYRIRTYNTDPTIIGYRLEAPGKSIKVYDDFLAESRYLAPILRSLWGAGLLCWSSKEEAILIYWPTKIRSFANSEKAFSWLLAIIKHSIPQNVRDVAYRLPSDRNLFDMMDTCIGYSKTLKFYYYLPLVVWIPPDGEPQPLSTLVKNWFESWSSVKQKPSATMRSRFMEFLCNTLCINVLDKERMFAFGEDLAKLMQEVANIEEDLVAAVTDPGEV